MECSLLTNVRPDAVTKRRDAVHLVFLASVRSWRISSALIRTSAADMWTVVPPFRHGCVSQRAGSFIFSAGLFCYFVYTAPAFIPFARKRLLYAANFFAGTFTTAFAYVPVNACAPTFLLVSESVLIVMERSFLQL